MAKRRMKKEVIVTLVVMGIIMIGAVICLSIAQHNRFDYEKNRDSIIVTMDCGGISLGELVYYIAKVEETGNEYALLYDKDNPTAYWSLYMQDETKESGYVSDIAKRTAIMSCIRDVIYANEAKESGFSVPEENLEDLIMDSENEFSKLSKRILELSGYTKEEYVEIKKREYISHQYVQFLANMGYGENLENVTYHYDIDGDYYKQLEEEYHVQIDNGLWDNVRVGFVTIN